VIKITRGGRIICKEGEKLAQAYSVTPLGKETGLKGRGKWAGKGNTDTFEGEGWGTQAEGIFKRGALLPAKIAGKGTKK